MRKHKLLILFVAVLLCASMLLTACGDSTGNVPGPEPTPDETPEEPKLPELLSYFVIDPTTNEDYIVGKDFTKVERIDGDVIWVETPDGKELMATVSDEVDHFNKDVIKVNLYRNDQIILTCETSYVLSDGVEKYVDMYFEDGILVFEVKVWDSEDGTLTYERTYYSYSETASPTKLYGGSDVEVYKVIGNLTVVIGNETVRWYSTSGSKVFEMTRDFYDTNGFSDAREYDGYLYFGGSRFIYVYDRDGKCIIEYRCAADCEYFDWYILDNGNIVLQEENRVLDLSAEAKFNYVDEYTGERYNVVTKIINYKTGAVTEKPEVDFFIYNLESNTDAKKYGTEFSFELVEGKQNQAVVYGFDKDGTDDNGKYVVIDNDLKIEFVFPVRDANVRIDSLAYNAYAVGDKYIVFDYYYGDSSVECVVDYYGNVVKTAPDIYYVTDKYIICRDAVYDLDFNLIYLSYENGVYFDGVIGDKVIAGKDANHDGEFDAYLVDPISGELTLVYDNINSAYCEFGDNYYVLFEYCDDCKAHYEDCELGACDSDICVYDLECYEVDCASCMHRLYSANGTLLLETSKGCIYVEEYNNTLVACVESWDYALNEWVEYYFAIK